MKKNHAYWWGLPSPAIPKLLLIMKLTAAFILVASMSLSAAGFSQDAKITMHLKGVKMAKLLKLIERQTAYRFAYSNDILPADVNVSVSAVDQPVKTVLESVLDIHGINFRYLEASNIIVLSKKPEVNSLSGQTALDRVITGRVTNENGEPLEGVTVSAKGSNAATTTDASGAFSIEVDASVSILIFSYIDMERQEVNVNGKQVVSINMKRKENIAEEVVVVGYGTTSRKKLVSAVSTIKTDKVVGLPFTNMADALAGRAPGIITQTSGGEPGQGFARIAIRGGSGPDRDGPLYVIDNIIGSYSQFANLQPQDIESISVLKDAAATAVYGARGSNGIILVTTKKGKSGKTTVNFSALSEWGAPTVLPKRINSYNYALAVNRAAELDGLGPNYRYRPGRLDTIKNQLDPYQFGNTDWYDITLRKYTPQKRYGVDMSGGNDKTTYFVSLAYFNQGSNYTTNVTTFDRYNARASVTNNFDKAGIKVGANLDAFITKGRYPGPSADAGAIWSHLQNTPPLRPPYNQDGTYSDGSDHPLVDIDPRTGYVRNQSNNLNTNVFLDWSIPWVKGLKASFQGNYRFVDDFSKRWNTRAPQFSSIGVPQPLPTITLEQEANKYWTYTIQSKLEYTTSFGEHDLGVMALFEQAEEYSDNMSAFRTNFVSPSVDQLFAGGVDGLRNSGTGSEGGRQGVVGRLQYAYANKYLLEASFRYDGTDNFAPNRWGFFPSLGLGWVVSSEKFFSGIKQKGILDYLKLRYSLGVVGDVTYKDPNNENRVTRFPYISNYGLNSNVYVVGGSLVNGFSEGRLVDPLALSWYKTNDYNTGLDFTTLNNKLSGSVDYFYKRTAGYITNPAAGYTTPLGTALPPVKANSSFRRAGWEFQLAYSNTISKDIFYSIGANLTTYQELWERNDREDSVTLKNPFTRTTHETDFLTRGYVNNGFYGSVEDIIANPRRTSANQLAAGDLYYQDINGDGKLDGNDQVRIGNSAFPHTSYGVNLTFGFKSLSLDMLWQGTGNRSFYRDGTLQSRDATFIVFDYQRNFWTPENPNADFPRATLQSGLNSNNNYTTSDFWLVNARYLRLRSLRLAFDAKKQFPTQLNFLSSCTVSLNATNLLTFSPAKKYFDPETSSASNYGYPVQKVFSLGINVGF